MSCNNTSVCDLLACHRDAGFRLERRPEPPVAIILCVLLVLAILSIKPILSNFGETRDSRSSVATRVERDV